MNPGMLLPDGRVVVLDKESGDGIQYRVAGQLCIVCFRGSVLWVDRQDGHPGAWVCRQCGFSPDRRRPTDQDRAETRDAPLYPSTRVVMPRQAGPVTRALPTFKGFDS